MKKMWLGFISIVCSFLLLVACSDTTSSPTISNSHPSFSSSNLIFKGEMATFFSSPDKFKGRSIVLHGQVFNILDGQFQIHADPEGATNDVIIQGDTSQLKNDDIVKVSGVIVGNQDYQNVMGATMSSPMIVATKVEKADYITAFHPTIRLIQVSQEKNRHGNKVKVEKIEIAEKQTRVYLTVKNDSKYKFSFYSSSVKLIQKGKQYEEQLGLTNPDAYKEVSSEIIPGSSTDGVVVFPAIQSNQPFKIYMEGMSGNFEIQLQPFVVEVKVN